MFDAISSQIMHNQAYGSSLRLVDKLISLFCYWPMQSLFRNTLWPTKASTEPRSDPKSADVDSLFLCDSESNDVDCSRLLTLWICISRLNHASVDFSTHWICTS